MEFLPDPSIGKMGFALHVDREESSYVQTFSSWQTCVVRAAYAFLNTSWLMKNSICVSDKGTFQMLNFQQILKYWKKMCI